MLECEGALLLFYAVMICDDPVQQYTYTYSMILLTFPLAQFQSHQPFFLFIEYLYNLGS